MELALDRALEVRDLRADAVDAGRVPVARVSDEANAEAATRGAAAGSSFTWYGNLVVRSILPPCRPADRAP